MKVARFVLFLATAVAVSSGSDDVDAPEYDNYALEDDIMRVIEEFRNKLKQGIPESNIPPLDPLDIKHQDIAVFVKDILLLNGAVSGVTGDGLVSFNVTKLKAKIPPIFLEIRLDWGAINARGNYNIDGNLISIIPIYGNGTFDFHLDGGHGYLMFEIGTKAAKVKLKKFEVDFGIKNVSVSLENFLDGPLGDMICQLINENLPTMIEQFKAGYLKGIRNYLMQEVNKFLDNVTMEELLEMIFGLFGTTTSAPTTTTPSATTGADGTTTMSTTMPDPATTIPTVAY